MATPSNRDRQLPPIDALPSHINRTKSSSGFVPAIQEIISSEFRGAGWYRGHLNLLEGIPVSGVPAFPFRGGRCRFDPTNS